MKKLLLLGLLLAGAAFGQNVSGCLVSGVWQYGPCPLPTPVAEAQSANSQHSTSAGTSITNAWGSNTTAGNTIVCLAMESAAAVPAISDGQGNTYSTVVSSATAPGYVIAVAKNIVGGTTNTITETVTSGSAAFTCHELKGPATVGQVWDQSNGQQGTGTTVTFSQIATAYPHEMVFAMAGFTSGKTVNATPLLGTQNTSSVTVDQSNQAATGGTALAVFYEAHSSLDSANVFTPTMSISASVTYSAAIVTIRAPFPAADLPDIYYQPVLTVASGAFTCNFALGYNCLLVYSGSATLTPTFSNLPVNRPINLIINNTTANLRGMTPTSQMQCNVNDGTVLCSSGIASPENGFDTAGSQYLTTWWSDGTSLWSTGNTGFMQTIYASHADVDTVEGFDQLNVNAGTGFGPILGTPEKDSNCTSAASPAACSYDNSGAVVVAAGATTVVVDDTNVTANSNIQLTFDSSLGSRLSVTCNTTYVNAWVSARTASTSFTLTVASAPTTNPACFTFRIVD